ncbi:MAG: hypothetical protein ACKOQ4_07870 [Mycobacterium sp.]
MLWRCRMLPAHLVHDSLSATLTVWVLGLVAFAVTAVGGWAAATARSSQRRLLTGLTCTGLGVVLFAGVVAYDSTLWH